MYLPWSLVSGDHSYQGGARKQWFIASCSERLRDIYFICELFIEIKFLLCLQSKCHDVAAQAIASKLFVWCFLQIILLLKSEARLGLFLRCFVEYLGNTIIIWYCCRVWNINHVSLDQSNIKIRSMSNDLGLVNTKITVDNWNDNHNYPDHMITVITDL